MAEKKAGCPIISFSIPADDVERAREFYGKLFGWTFEQADGEPSCWETEGCGGLGGVLHPRFHPQQTAVQYIAVESLDDCLANLQQCGGKPLTPILDSTVRKGARHCVCIDPEGNTFGIVEYGTEM